MHGVEQWAAPAGDTTTHAEELRQTDVLVVLGGDGTFLRAAQSVAEVDVPIVGINLGKVGFLSMAEANELEGLLEKLKAGAYTIRERMALTGQILQAGRTPDGSFTALAPGADDRPELSGELDDHYVAELVPDKLTLKRGPRLP